MNRLGYLIAGVPTAPDHTYSGACEDLTEARRGIRAARERAVSPPLQYRRLWWSVVPVAQAGPPWRIFPPSRLRNKILRNLLDRATHGLQADSQVTWAIRACVAPHQPSGDL